jgi:hypothetical protein
MGGLCPRHISHDLDHQLFLDGKKGYKTKYKWFLELRQVRAPGGVIEARTGHRMGCRILLRRSQDLSYDLQAIK